MLGAPPSRLVERIGAVAEVLEIAWAWQGDCSSTDLGALQAQATRFRATDHHGVTTLID
jgi:hypothetical protein